MTQSPATILMIEDEREIRRFLRVSLDHLGYRLIEAENAQQGLLHATQDLPDLIVLDLGLPDLDGLEVIQQVRSWSQVPIIVLSARGQEREKVAALDAGADDYLTKPFSVGELLARIRVALRRKTIATEATTDALFQVDQLSVNLAARQVHLTGEEIRLTPTEYRLLTTLVKYAGRVVTHRQLLKEVWGPDSVQENHYLRVYMAQLRQKLEPDPTCPRYLLTEPGVGYRLAGE